MTDRSAWQSRVALILVTGACLEASHGAAAPPSPARSLHAVKGGSVKTAFPEGVAEAKAIVDQARASSVAAQAARTPRRPPTPTPAAPVRKVFDPKTSAPSPGGNGIHAVDGVTQGYAVTPGGYVTIRGAGFGDRMAQANVIGKFPNGAAALRVVDWRDDEVYALLPDIRGVVDHPIQIQVVTSDLKTYFLGGGRFIATREEIPWTTNVNRFLSFQGEGYGAPPASLDGAGNVERQVEGACSSTHGFGSGEDTLSLVKLGGGFVVVGLAASHGPDDTGETAASGGPGFREFAGAYRWEPWTGSRINFEWGVWKNVEGKQGSASSSCEWFSTYQISVVVSGPAGASPF
ncbi:MAG TPA: hypothetical protein VMN04_03660 [Thermoanaerobaculia bacterium]|nr:hypothetical protein [Thermoanaerobaculia bacterium]